MNLNKSCFSLVDCELKNHCSLYQVPNANMHFMPANVGEGCHYYTSKDNHDVE